MMMDVEAQQGPQAATTRRQQACLGDDGVPTISRETSRSGWTLGTRKTTSSTSSRSRRGLTVYDQDFEIEVPDGILDFEGEEDDEAKRVLGGERRTFPEGVSTVVEPYRTNPACKALMLLGFFLGPFYLHYLWSHRRPDRLAFGACFFIGELINFLLGSVNRFLLWHRQRRHVCRLDTLTPAFPRKEWPKAHICFTHYMEPPADSVEPLRQAVLQDYPADALVVTILDDGYHRRAGDAYETTAVGHQMEAMVLQTLASLSPLGVGGVEKKIREVWPGERRGYRHEVAPGGSTVVEFRAPGLPLVRLVGRKKGPESFMKAGNLENALWNVMEEDAVFMTILDSDMAPVPEMLQILLPPMLECCDGTWRPNWRTAYVETPQDFKNIESAWGADDPMNQANKFFWYILPPSLDSMGFVPFWGTNAAFFVPALKDTRGFVYRCMSEDTVTGAQLHQLGWTSCFVGAPIATGLCRESVTETFDQRKRWCQGNVQQLFIEWNPPYILHEDFRNPPYRRAFRQHLQETRAADAEGSSPAVPVSDDDTGAEQRRARRTWSWRLRRQLAYFPTKHAFWYHVQPFYYYAVTLAILFNGKPPFLLERGPVATPWEVLNRFHIVLAYWGVCALANFLAYSYVLGDANNPNSPLWRVQQEFWGYAWVRMIAVFEATVSAIFGRQPSWNALGAKGGVNWVFELPIATAFVAMVLSMVVVTANYVAEWHLGSAFEALPRPSQVRAGGLLGALMACSWVLVLMWPVTSCVLADIFRLPYYRLSAILTTLVAATVQVGISVFFFGASLSGGA